MYSQAAFRYTRLQNQQQNSLKLKNNNSFTFRLVPAQTQLENAYKPTAPRQPESELGEQFLWNDEET